MECAFSFFTLLFHIIGSVSTVGTWQPYKVGQAILFSEFFLLNLLGLLGLLGLMLLQRCPACPSATH